MISGVKRTARSGLLVGSAMDAVAHLVVGDALLLRPILDRQVRLDLLDLLVQALGIHCSG